MLHIGIDFGTTNTVVSYSAKGKNVILNLGDSPFVPSVIGVKGEERFFGFDALDHIAEKECATVIGIKSQLHNYYEGKWIEAGETRLDIQETMVSYFKYIRQKIEDSLPFGEGAEWDVVATVPANATSRQRWVTRTAMRAAGIPVRGLLNEPTAAAFEFAHFFLEGRSFKNRPGYVLVYDLGGGTFDASLLKIHGDAFEVLGSVGKHNLGGFIFDRKLFALAAGEGGLDRRRLNFKQRVEGLIEARAVKESVTMSRGLLQKNLHFDFENAGIDLPAVKIKSSKFYQAIQPDIEQTLSLVDRLFEQESISDEVPGRDSVDYIYLVGGSSRLPYIYHFVTRKFPKTKVKLSDNPFGTAALGAAIYAAEKGIELKERFTRHFGVIRYDNTREYFDPIFPAGTEIPAGHDEVRTVTREYVPEFNVGKFRFLECSEIGWSSEPRGDVVMSDEIRFPFEPELLDPDQVEIERRRLEGVRVKEEYRCDRFGIIDARVQRLNDKFSMGYSLHG